MTKCRNKGQKRVKGDPEFLAWEKLVGGDVKMIEFGFGCVCVCVCVRTWLCPTHCNPMDGSPLDSSVHGIFQNTGVGCHTLLQEIFLTKRWNPCLLNWQAYYLPLHHLGSPVLNVLGLKCPEASQVSLSSRQACMQVRSLTEEAGTKI